MDEETINQNSTISLSDFELVDAFSPALDWLSLYLEPGTGRLAFLHITRCSQIVGRGQVKATVSATDTLVRNQHIQWVEVLFNTGQLRDVRCHPLGAKPMPCEAAWPRGQASFEMGINGGINRMQLELHLPPEIAAQMVRSFCHYPHYDHMEDALDVIVDPNRF